METFGKVDELFQSVYNKAVSFLAAILKSLVSKRME